MSKQLTFGKPKLARKRGRSSIKDLLPKKKRGRKSKWDRSGMYEVPHPIRPDPYLPDWLTRNYRISFASLRTWCLNCDCGINAIDLGLVKSNTWDHCKIFCCIEGQIYDVFKSVALCPGFVDIPMMEGMVRPEKKKLIVWEEDAIEYVAKAEKI